MLTNQVRGLIKRSYPPLLFFYYFFTEYDKSVKQTEADNGDPYRCNVHTRPPKLSSVNEKQEGGCLRCLPS